jgi:hypothetical protein
MAMLVWTPLPTAQEMLLLTQQKNTGLGSDQAINYAIANALMAQINTAGSPTSTTVSMSGYTAQDIQNAMKLLSGLCFIVSYLGTTLTISWNV